MSRIAIVVICAGFAFNAPGAPVGAALVGVALVAAAPAAATAVYAPPLGGPIRVIRPFVAPPGPYAPGHRGVDLEASDDEVVLAAATGRVSFAGTVAERGVVVIAHPDGVVTEYEPVTPAVRHGDRVTRGQRIGRVHGSHGACAPNRCLHWGARRGAVYLDPMTLLMALGPVRLLPWPT